MVPHFYGSLGIVGGYHGSSGERMMGKETLLFKSKISVGEIFLRKGDNCWEKGSREDFVEFAPVVF